MIRTKIIKKYSFLTSPIDSIITNTIINANVVILFL